MTTKLALYQKALSFIGTERLHATTGLTEDVTSRYVLDGVYDDCVADCLEMGVWKFALRTVEATYDTGIEPTFGPARAYPQPDDYVRLAGMASDAYFRAEVHQWNEEAGIWYMDIDTVYIKYVSNHADYGLDLGAWPPSFSRVVACHMAIESNLPITKSRGDRNELIAEFQNIILPRAKRLDAVDEPIKKRPSGSWVNARFRGNAGRTYTRNGKIGTY